MARNGEPTLCTELHDTVGSQVMAARKYHQHGAGSSDVDNCLIIIFVEIAKELAASSLNFLIDLDVLT